VGQEHKGGPLTKDRANAVGGNNLRVKKDSASDFGEGDSAELSSAIKRKTTNEVASGVRKKRSTI